MYNTNNILKGELALEGDKSVSHRALMIASLIKDDSIIYNLSACKDVLTTMKCLQQCGISIKHHFMKFGFKIKGGSLSQPSSILNCENSGSTARMLIGLLAGQGISASFSGDDSLTKRPMRRIIDPLLRMGIKIKSHDNHLPIAIDSNISRPLNYSEKTKSAQVKSSLMFAGLGSTQYSHIAYNQNTRDHTEKALTHINCHLKINERIAIKKTSFKKGFKIQIPGDISNAAFLIGASIIIPGSKIKINNVLFNSTRMAFINILKKMGAKIKISNINHRFYESMCTIESQFTPNLKAIKIDQSNIIQLIDEIPILSIVATQASGTTIIKDAEELRIKETDRINAIYQNLKSMQAAVEELKTGLSITGGKQLHSSNIVPFGDHRIAMSFEILNFLISGKHSGQFQEIIDISFPRFYEYIDYLNK